MGTKHEVEDELKEHTDVEKGAINNNNNNNNSSNKKQQPKKKSKGSHLKTPATQKKDQLLPYTQMYTDASQH